MVNNHTSNTENASFPHLKVLGVRKTGAGPKKESRRLTCSLYFAVFTEAILLISYTFKNSPMNQSENLVKREKAQVCVTCTSRKCV